MKKPRYQRVNFTVRVTDFRGLTDEQINKITERLNKAAMGRADDRIVVVGPK